MRRNINEIHTESTPPWRQTREAYLKKIPTEVPTGRVVVHNNVRPARRPGTRGFRAWYADPAHVASGALIRCRCGWAPELGAHFVPAAAILRAVLGCSKRTKPS